MSARSRFTIVQPEGNVSWHVGVRTSDGRFRTIGKRMRDRKDKTKKRRAWTLTQLESSELPAAGPSDDEEAWETLIDGVHDRWTKEENVSRKMDKAREYCKRWNGKVPITDLSRDGYADLGVLSGIQKKDLSTLRRCIMASTARSHTHGGAVKETPTTSIFLKEPGEKVEQWMEEEGATTVQGEELGALRRIKAALKAAVGKEGMDRTITEGLVAKLGREGRPAQTAYPERHGDFLQPHEIPDEWSEEEKGEAAENSFTTPVLAVMLVLSPGGAVQTLFPSMSKKFTQTMGEQPIAWGREEGEEEVNYYEGRFLRWELVKQGGKGDQVPMSSASGASSGVTKGGKTRAHPSRSGARSPTEDGRGREGGAGERGGEGREGEGGGR